MIFSYSDNSSKKEPSPLSKYLLEILEFVIGWLLAVIVYAITRELLALTVGAVGTYAALLTLVFRHEVTSINEMQRRIIEETTQLRVEIPRLMREKESIYITSLVKYHEGRYEVLEKQAVETMRSYAETFQEQMIATSYYDVAAWLAMTEHESFWSVYDRRARMSLERVKLRYKTHIPEEEQLNVFLAEHPIITRIFIVEPTMWSNCKTIVEAHLGISGYRVVCALKDAVTKVGLADESRRGRMENLHDCVMFDNKIVVEAIQEKSEWPGGLVNTYGAIYIPTLERGNYWIDQFKAYFTRVLQESCSYEEMDKYCVSLLQE